MTVPVFNCYTIKVRSIYDQTQNNNSAISEVVIRVSDSLINSVISLRRLDISNLLSAPSNVIPLHLTHNLMVAGSIPTGPTKVILKSL